MQTVRRFPLEDRDRARTTVVTAPIVKVLDVAYIDGKPYVWGVIDTKSANRRVHVSRAFPGERVRSLGKYLATTSNAKDVSYHWFYKIDSAPAA